MTRDCLVRLVLVGVGLVALGRLGVSVYAQKEKGPADARLAGQAQAILRRHCFECHGLDPKKIKGEGLNILDHALLKERKSIVPGDPDRSDLIKQVEEEAMPPGRRLKLSLEDRKTLRDWIKAGAAPFPETAAPQPGIAARVKDLFQSRCFECHGGSTVSGGVKVLDRAQLVGAGKIDPGKPDASVLFQRITAKDASVMPKKPALPLANDEVELVRSWIAAVAPAFPENVKPDKGPPAKPLSGDDYVHKTILAHVRKVAETAPADVGYLRFFSINHLLTSGATSEKLQMHRLALAKAVNHLTWKKDLVQPAAIDPPLNSIYAVDVRALGWDQKPFTRNGAESELTLFDLVLLEYPYATVYDDSRTFDALAKDFLDIARQVRPVVFLRADWFVSVATQPPLYEDLLQLPRELKDLEKKLEVNAKANLKAGTAWRAGMTRSFVSHNNRVVERHPARYGALWRSYDYRSGKGDDNIFRNPVDLYPAGGEMIFNLANGLQGYFVTNARDERVEFAPTEIVTDDFAADRTVRNGLSCMRCHDRGMKEVVDAVRQAVELLPLKAGVNLKDVLRLYPPQAKINEALAADGKRFTDALKEALGGVLPAREPLAGVTTGFLDDPLYLSAAAAELGLPDGRPLKTAFRMPQFAALGLMPLAAEPVPGAVRRDAWEDYYDQVVRALGLATPIVPLDGLSRRDYRPAPANAKPALNVSLTASRTVLKAGDKLTITVTNHSKTEVYIELVSTGVRGQKSVVPLSNNCLRPGQSYTLKDVEALPAVGKDQFTLFASDEEFPAGVVHKGKDGKDGEGLADRVVHAVYQLGPAGRRTLRRDAARILKKTIEVETR